MFAPAAIRRWMILSIKLALLLLSVLWVADFTVMIVTKDEIRQTVEWH